MPVPARLQPLTADHDPALRWAELVELVAALVDAELSDDEHDRALDYLEANLPGAAVQDLIDWPGDWFGNRWLEEVALAPEDVAFYALERAGRELPGAPDDYEPPFPPR